jgi:chromosome segregation ATPase
LSTSMLDCNGQVGRVRDGLKEQKTGIEKVASDVSQMRRENQVVAGRVDALDRKWMQYDTHQKLHAEQSTRLSQCEHNIHTLDRKVDQALRELEHKYHGLAQEQKAQREGILAQKSAMEQMHAQPCAPRSQQASGAYAEPRMSSQHLVQRTKQHH